MVTSLVIGVIIFFILVNVMKVFMRWAIILTIIITLLFAILMNKFEGVSGDGHGKRVSCSGDAIGCSR